MYLYVIVREVGEHSDRMDTPIAAYTDKDLAERHAKLAADHEDRQDAAYEKAASVAYQGSHADEVTKEHTEAKQRMKEIQGTTNPYDSDHSYRSYDAASYSIHEIPLLEEIPGKNRKVA